ncbi:MAG: hypothetical protein IPL11_17900 [Candidatus Accumulibacter sp.]|nr:hypothetical protein [Accumulibacter sp.]
MDSEVGGVGPSIVAGPEWAKSLTSTTAKNDIYAFIFSQKGLMAGLGLQGKQDYKIERLPSPGAERDAEHLLALRFRDAIAGAPLRMAEVAPLLRREVAIDPQTSCTELRVRSFYKGTLQHRTVPGSDFSWQDLYRIQSGELVLNDCRLRFAQLLPGPGSPGCLIATAAVEDFSTDPRDHAGSKRSRFINRADAATKSCTNACCESLQSHGLRRGL